MSGRITCGCHMKQQHACAATFSLSLSLPFCLFVSLFFFFIVFVLNLIFELFLFVCLFPVHVNVCVVVWDRHSVVVGPSGCDGEGTNWEIIFLKKYIYIHMLKLKFVLSCSALGLCNFHYFLYVDIYLYSYMEQANFSIIRVCNMYVCMCKKSCVCIKRKKSLFSSTSIECKTR